MKKEPPFRPWFSPLPDRTHISDDELHICWVRLDGGNWPSVERLPAADRNRAERLLCPETQRRWVSSRWALRGVLARYTSQLPEEVRLCMGSRGKPMLPASASLRFNLSHSGDLAVIAVAQNREVGVDVEQIRRRRSVLELARRVLPAEDMEVIEAAPPQSRLAAFHSAWVWMEATAKCVGTGLADPIPESDIAVRDFDVGADFAAAVAIAGKTVPALRHFAIRPADFGCALVRQD